MDLRIGILALLPLLPLAPGQNPGPQAQQGKKQEAHGGGKAKASDKETQTTSEEALEKARTGTPADERKRLEEQVLLDFSICDLDQNRWISFREASASLGLSRTEYMTFDDDADGRIQPAEFARRYLEITDRLGSFRRPQPPRPTPLATELLPTGEATEATASPADLLSLYDENLSGGLDRRELSKMYLEVGVGLSATVSLRQLDPDESGELESGELGTIAGLVGERLPETSRARGEERLEGILRPTFPRIQQEDGAVLTPRIPGPVGHFRRLDLYDDGFIDVTDLQELTYPARTGVRPASVIAALDTDGDGKLSSRELMSSMGG